MDATSIGTLQCILNLKNFQESLKAKGNSPSYPMTASILSNPAHPSCYDCMFGSEFLGQIADPKRSLFQMLVQSGTQTQGSCVRAK